MGSPIKTSENADSKKKRTAMEKQKNLKPIEFIIVSFQFCFSLQFPSNI
jgi:hypothetical protein